MGKQSGARLGFEDKLWNAADKLRGTMDAAEYKHVVLGLIFLKFISDSFAEKYCALEKQLHANPEDPDEYSAENIFWVPQVARWEVLQSAARQPEIGQLVDKAMRALEKDNPTLKRVLPKDYARPELDKTRLGELIDLIATIGLGDEKSREKDILGRVYEYFLARFAEKEGKGGGEFYTPQCVVKLLVEMIEPFEGRVFDPCCGSGGMFVQAIRFVEAHIGRGAKKRADEEIAIYGQEMNYTTWRLAIMNMAIRQIDANIVWNEKGSFLQNAHKDLKADFVLANPPFNDEDWGFSKVQDDVRWKYGAPPGGGERRQADGSIIHVDGGNANYAWIQHFIHHLAPKGVAAFVLANASMVSATTSEAAIRKALVEADLVDCMIAMPGQLFYTTTIPVCLWFLTRSKTGDRKRGFRDRSRETLFIDARGLGELVDRTHRELSDDEVGRIAETYHNWRGQNANVDYEDVVGFCKSATLGEIQNHEYALTPSEYVGVVRRDCDGEGYEEGMERHVSTLRQQLASIHELDARILTSLKSLGTNK